MAIQPLLRNINFDLNIIWFLEDVDENNKATRVFPLSHFGNVVPEDVVDLEGSVAAQGPAGTTLCFES